MTHKRRVTLIGIGLALVVGAAVTAFIIVAKNHEGEKHRYGRTTTELIAELKDPNPDRRHLAVTWLGEMTSTQARDALHGAMLNDDDARIRSEAAKQVMDRIGDDELLAGLIAIATIDRLGIHVDDDSMYRGCLRLGPKARALLPYLSAAREDEEEIIRLFPVTVERHHAGRIERVTATLNVQTGEHEVDGVPVDTTERLRKLRRESTRLTKLDEAIAAIETPASAGK